MSDSASRAELVAFGRTLRQIRRHRDLSQEALAMLAGVSPKHISDIERAIKDPRLSTIARLAAALEVERAELFHAYDLTLAADARVGAARRL